jgi:hypothetical protein
VTNADPVSPLFVVQMWCNRLLESASLAVRWTRWTRWKNENSHASETLRSSSWRMDPFAFPGKRHLIDTPVKGSVHPRVMVFDGRIWLSAPAGVALAQFGGRSLG